MASKRMSISALLSNNAHTSPRPASPAPVPSDEPPLKRQRQHQDYTQQYYDSYNAYPYSPSNTSVSPTTGYYSQSQHQGHPITGQNPPAPQTWQPRTSSSHAESHSHWDDGRRYAPASNMSNASAFDFVRQHRETSNLRGAEDDEVAERAREGEARWKPPGAMMGESLVSVLAGQMRGPRQGPVALPAPPQLRRDAHHHHTYVAPIVMDSLRAEVRSRDISPIAVKPATPRMTPPSLSPRSSYTPYNLSPTATHAQHSTSPTIYAQRNASPSTLHASQSASPTTMYASRTVSPTTEFVLPSTSSSPQYAPNIPPSTLYPPPPQRPPTMTHAAPNISPTRSYVPLPFRAPSRPPSSRSHDATMESPVSRPRSPAALPPAPPQQLPPTASGPMDDDRSFEDELLSLVDGDDVKPKVPQPATAMPVPQLPPSDLLIGKNSSPSSSSKPASTKPKAPPKPRAPPKSKAKPTARQASGASTPVPASSMPPPSPPPKQTPVAARAKGKAPAGGNKRKTGTGSGVSLGRSRSLSVKPAEPTPTPAPDVEMTRDDDRLYCLCRTPYDEDKVMIACDRCDEWYHPACVGMPEAEVDLVDQFICEACVRLNPSLHTTYKQRCHRGLNHIVPYDTLPPCWKPARGAFSKYCSDDCGMAHMRAKVAQSGRDPATIWPVVKNARRREGVTVTNAPRVKSEEQPDDEKDRKKAALAEARKAQQEADEREMGELLRRLEEIMRAREECKAALECVGTRRRLLDLAVDRASGRPLCGWDLRLEMGDEEWAGWVATEAGRRALDGREAEAEANWWCQGENPCRRHQNWQSFRDLDVQVEVDSKNASIKQLTDRERELRRRIEDLDPPSEPIKPSRRKKSQAKKSAR